MPNLPSRPHRRSVSGPREGRGLLYPPSQLCYNPLRLISFQERAPTLTQTAPETRPTLIAATEHQDEVFPAAFQILNQAIADRAFPAASIAITHRGRLIARKAFGRFVYPEDGTASQGAPCFSHPSRAGGDFAVKPSTPFDLASVTKVVATTAMAMILYERGLLDLDIQVEAVVPEFVSKFQAATGAPDARRREVTIRELLAHSSGLPAYEKLFLKHRTRDELLRAAYGVPLTGDPGTRAEYSDIGFILLGVALERIARESLDRFCRKEIFSPLGMKGTVFNPPPHLRPQIAPTANENEEEEKEPWGPDTPARDTPEAKEHPSASRSKFRGRIIQGEVQDENAFLLGGVAGHAGLFSTAEDLAKFAHAMLQWGAGSGSASSGQAAARALPKTSHDPKKNKISTPGQEQLLRPETIALFTKRQATSNGTSRALGWDTPSTPSQSGKYFSPQSYGHLGYTGTSLWIDPMRETSVTLLTNRTWPDGSNQSIKEVRPRFHDAVIEALPTSE